jgi:hypothetical protein
MFQGQSEDSENGAGDATERSPEYYIFFRLSRILYFELFLHIIWKSALKGQFLYTQYILFLQVPDQLFYYERGSIFILRNCQQNKILIL